MKKRFCLALGLALCLAACDSKEEPAAKKDAPAAEAKAPAAEEAPSAQKLLEGVELTPKSMYQALYKDKPQNQNADFDLLMLTHESPIVRAYIYNRSTRNYGKDSEYLPKFVAQLKNEKDPTVIAAGIQSLMNDLGASEELYQFVLANGKHEDAKVREEVAYVLSGVNNKNVAGIYDEAIKFIKDPDKSVRKAVCKRLPAHGNEAIIDELVKILNSNEADDADIHDGCLEGLISMWYDWPLFQHHSEKAYKATLAYLKKTPRGKNNPPWNGFSSLHWGYEKASVEWMNGSPYFKAADIAAVMMDIAKDTNAEWLARKSAVDAVTVFGSVKDLETLNAAIKDTSTFDNRSVKESIASAIKKKNESK